MAVTEFSEENDDDSEGYQDPSEVVLPNTPLTLKSLGLVRHATSSVGRKADRRADSECGANVSRSINGT